MFIKYPLPRKINCNIILPDYISNGAYAINRAVVKNLSDVIARGQIHKGIPAKLEDITLKSMTEELNSIVTQSTLSGILEKNILLRINDDIFAYAIKLSDNQLVLVNSKIIDLFADMTYTILGKNTYSAIILKCDDNILAIISPMRGSAERLNIALDNVRNGILDNARNGILIGNK